MENDHVISGLRQKRAEVKALAVDLERKLKHQMATLVAIDATLRIFAVGIDPETIPNKQIYRRSKYFRPAELSRRCVDVLREGADKGMSASAITEAVMAAKNLPLDDIPLRRHVRDAVLGSLRGLQKRGTVVKTGVARDALWWPATE